MAMVVQHNMQAMNSNRVLGGTTLAQAKSTEKLSSGFRINRAADDAAGLTISEKMRKQIKGLNRASKNAQDGISAVQTAEGALTEVHSMLQRMNELSTQAANGTNSKSDRDAIQSEIGQLTTEIDRVAETTKFNETYLLKGDNGEKTINLPAHDAGLKGKLTDNGDGTATFEMKELEAGDKVMIGGKEYTIGETQATVDKANETVTKSLEEKIDGAGNHFKKGDEVTINGVKCKYHDGSDDCKPVTAAGGTTPVKLPKGWYKDEDFPDATTLKTMDKDTVVAKLQVKLEGKVEAKGETFNFAKATIKDDGQNGGKANDGVDDNDTSLITVDHAYELAAKELKEANSIGDTESKALVGIKKDATGVHLPDKNQNEKYGSKFEIQVGSAKVPQTLSFNLHVGSDADMTNKINVNVEAMTSAYLGVKNLNVSDETGNAATYAIDSIGDAISKVSAQRSSLGAIQNRLEHTIANLDNISENTTAAESRIRDTDMASEMVEYSKNNILKQAGTSMLAQANQSSQGVLSLLQ